MTEASYPVYPAYQGDEIFTRLLADVQCPLALHQVKALLLGGAAATHMPRLHDLLSALWEGAQPTFESMEQVQAFTANLFGLMNLLAAGQGGERWGLTPLAEPASVQEVSRYASTRYEEVQGFIRGLDLGDTDPDGMRPEALEALRTLAEGSAWLEAYRNMAAKQPAESPETLRETCEILRGLDDVLQRAMAIILRAQREQRAQALERAHGRNGPSPAIRKGTPGRNDPCPCGSGKKYKRCCGQH